MVYINIYVHIRITYNDLMSQGTLVNSKIAGKWSFMSPNMVLRFYPYVYVPWYQDIRLYTYIQYIQVIQYIQAHTVNTENTVSYSSPLLC